MVFRDLQGISLRFIRKLSGIAGGASENRNLSTIRKSVFSNDAALRVASVA
jgi:hypothetical protein